MPFEALVYRVLIASPSDVKADRKAATDAITEWNLQNSANTGIVFMPRLWERHVAPAMGERPQEIVNSQIVDDADILIGIFGTRLGTPTGADESGTAEEIKRVLERRGGENVLIYFSSKPINPHGLDAPEFERLKQFKAQVQNQGIFQEYRSAAALKSLVDRHLDDRARKLRGNGIMELERRAPQPGVFETDSDTSNSKINFDGGSEEDQEMGLLDFAADVEDAMEATGTRMKQIGTIRDTYLERIQNIQPPANGDSANAARGARAMVAALSTQVNRMSADVGKEVDGLEADLNRLERAGSGLVAAMPVDDTTGIQQLQNQLVELNALRQLLEKSIADAKAQRIMMAEHRGISRDFDKADRRWQLMCDRLVEMYLGWQGVIDGLSQAYSNRLAMMNPE